MARSAGVRRRSPPRTVHAGGCRADVRPMSSADLEKRDGRGRLAIPRPPLWAVALVSAVVLGVHLVWPAGPAGDTTYLVALLGAAALAWLVVASSHRRDRRAWSMVALGISVSAAADLVWYVHYWTTGAEPDVSLADPLWLASYVALAVGLMRLTPGRGGSRRVAVDALIDSRVPAGVVLGAGVVLRAGEGVHRRQHHVLSICLKRRRGQSRTLGT